jgi:hypothetical protein
MVNRRFGSCALVLLGLLLTSSHELRAAPPPGSQELVYDAQTRESSPIPPAERSLQSVVEYIDIRRQL